MLKSLATYAIWFLDQKAIEFALIKIKSVMQRNVPVTKSWSLSLHNYICKKKSVFILHSKFKVSYEMCVLNTPNFQRLFEKMILCFTDILFGHESFTIISK